jgi:endonuclease/exonuclease/phosphatase family metal-dependent hydrolase
VAVLAALSSACATKANYVEPAGPRYAADYSVSEGTTAATLKVVSYNVRYGLEVDEAIEVLARTPVLADADVVLLQEMHPFGVDRIARALDCSYVYYPASRRTSGRDFGNAVLTRGRIAEDEKVLLPHVNPFNRQSRIAVRTGLELGAHRLQAYSVHTETPYLNARKRTDQIETLLGSVSGDGGPCLIAGDFNTMGRGSLRSFDSSFAARGFERATAGCGSTFELGPVGFALDHVFVRGLEVVDAGVVAGAGASDHAPIWVELVWAPGPRPGPRPGV